jgi:hypothetical protein
MPLLWGAVAFLVGGAFLGGPAWMGPAGLALLVAGLALYFRVGTVRRPPVEVDAPVAGRWQAVNSPADKVPSHGLHAYGQTYAIDVVREPADGSRPQFGTGPSFRPPEDYPAFGQPVFAPADGVVVRVHGRERDRRSRSSWPSLLYLLVEGSLRELTGPSRVLGNHLVLDLGHGIYAVLAHLRRRAGRRLRELGQLHRAAPPLPADGPPQCPVRRRPALPAGQLRGRRRDPGRGAGQQPPVHRELAARRGGGPRLGDRPGYRLQWVSPRR